MQWAWDPQSAVSSLVHGQPAWFAKQRPPVQWLPLPQSPESLHVRSPLVGHSFADGSIGPWLSPPRQATETTMLVKSSADRTLFVVPLPSERLTDIEGP